MLGFLGKNCVERTRKCGDGGDLLSSLSLSARRCPPHFAPSHQLNPPTQHFFLPPPPLSSPAASQCQQLSRLLHLAAGHGLRTVAEFLLQQPGGREALRRPNARGLTAARLAESRGHGQLAELFTQ